MGRSRVFEAFDVVATIIDDFPDGALDLNFAEAWRGAQRTPRRGRAGIIHNG